MSDYVGEIKLRTAAERERDSAAEAAALIAKGQAGKGPKVGTGLSEPRTDNVATGAQHGDPEHRERLRAVEIMGAHGTGTVCIKVKGADGKLAKRASAVPATVENLTEALRQAKLGTPKLPASIAAKARKVEELAHWLKAAKAAPAVRKGMQAPRAGAAKGGRDHGTVDGVALVRGLVMPAVEPPRVNARGGAMNAAGWGDSLGRERADRAAVQGAAFASEHDAEKFGECRARQCVHFFGRSKEAQQGRYTHSGRFPFGMTWRDYSSLPEGHQQKRCWSWDKKQQGRERRAAVAAKAAEVWQRDQVTFARRRAEAAVVNAGGSLDEATDGTCAEDRLLRDLMRAPGARLDEREHGSLGAARQH